MDSPELIEFNQINEYVRHELGVYFAWLSFFLAIILAAMSWVLKASVTATGTIEHFPFTFFVLLIFFMVQIQLGVRATSAVIEDIAHAEARTRSLLQSLIHAAAPDAPAPKSPVPQGYRRALILSKKALVANLIFWPVVALYVLLAWHYGFALGSPGSGP